MPAAVKVTRTTHTAEDLRSLARSGKDARQNARLLMVALVLEGGGAAKIEPARVAVALNAIEAEMVLKPRGRAVVV